MYYQYIVNITQKNSNWIVWKNNEMIGGQWPHIQILLYRVFCLSFFSFLFVRSIVCVPDSHFFHPQLTLTHAVQSVSFFRVPTFYPKLKQWNFDVFVTYSHTFFIFHIMSHLIWIKTHIFSACHSFVYLSYSCVRRIVYIYAHCINCYVAVDVANRVGCPWLLCFFSIPLPTTAKNKYPAFDF